MIEGEDMAPSKDWRRSMEGRGSDAVSNYLLPKVGSERRDGSINASDSFGIKESRDGNGGGNGGDNGGDNGGSNGGGGGKSKGNGGGDKNKPNNKVDKGGGGGGGGNPNNNPNNNPTDNFNNSPTDSFNNNPTDTFNNNNNPTDTTTVPVFVIPSTTPGFPPLAVPVATLVSTSSPPEVTTTKTSVTTSISTATATSTKPVTSIVQTTSVVTTIQMSTMTTTVPVITTIIPSVTISSQPRKGVDGPPPDFTSPFSGSSTAVETVTATDTTATVTATALADTLSGSDNSDNSNNTKGNGGHNGKKDSNSNNNPPPGALDPSAEHALIAVGSIGGFVLICFVAWVIYRTLKKSKRGQDRSNGNGGFINRLPWRRNQNNDMWNDRSAYNDMPPPMYEKGSHNSMQEAGFYGAEKMYQQPQPGLTRTNTASSQRSMLPQLAPGSVIMIPAEQYMAMSQAQSPVGSDQTSTMRSRMPDAFFNQSELARQPSDAYDPARRQVNRASELSSLSSGFGDGDIIIPEEYLNKPQPAASQLRQSNNFITRFSWMSRRDAGDRETVYTTTSEDRPAKYRSVGSWVNQQTGRLKRADERQQEVPPVPDIPSNLDSQGPR